MAALLKSLMPVVALMARIMAPKLLDWIAANKMIPGWLKPVITEVLTGLLAALAATATARQMSSSRGRKVRAGLRKMLK